MKRFPLLPGGRVLLPVWEKERRGVFSSAKSQMVIGRGNEAVPLLPVWEKVSRRSRDG